MRMLCIVDVCPANSFFNPTNPKSKIYMYKIHENRNKCNLPPLSSSIFLLQGCELLWVFWRL